MNIVQIIFSKITSILITILISMGILNTPVLPTPVQPVSEAVVDLPEAIVPPPKVQKPELITTSSTSEIQPLPLAPIPVPAPIIVVPPLTTYVPVYTQQPTSGPVTVQESAPVIEEAKPEPPKKSLASISIISPISGKGIGPRPDPVTGEDMGYVASPTVENESNYIYLGLIVYDDEGLNTKTAMVTITATDSIQNKVLNGTGNLNKIYENGVWKEIYYYPFNYEFRFAGQHTITFSTNGMITSVDLMVK